MLGKLMLRDPPPLTRFRTDPLEGFMEDSVGNINML